MPRVAVEFPIVHPRVCAHCLQLPSTVLRMSLAKDALGVEILAGIAKGFEYGLDVPYCTFCVLRRWGLIVAATLLPWLVVVGVALAWRYSESDYYGLFTLSVFVAIVWTAVGYKIMRACLWDVRILGAAEDASRMMLEIRRPPYAEALANANPGQVFLLGQAAAHPPKRPVRRR